MPRTDRLRELKDKVRVPPAGFKFLTVTLSPKMYKYTPVQQYIMTSGKLERVLYNCCSDYCIVVELTKEANVHYHVWFICTSSFQEMMLRVSLKKLRRANGYGLGYHCISRENPDKSMERQRYDCYEYMIKSLDETKRIFENYYHYIVSNYSRMNIDREDQLESCGISEALVNYEYNALDFLE